MYMVGMSPKTFHFVTPFCRARKVQGISNWSFIFLSASGEVHRPVSAPWLKFNAGSRENRRSSIQSVCASFTIVFISIHMIQALS